MANAEIEELIEDIRDLERLNCPSKILYEISNYINIEKQRLQGTWWVPTNRAGGCTWCGAWAVVNDDNLCYDCFQED